MANSNITAEDLLDMFRARDVSTRERDVYKDKKIERQKDSSRQLCEDADVGKVAVRPAFGLEAVASKPSAVDFVSSQELPKGESGNVISPRELTSRYSGISVQYVRTDKGVKVAITLQKPEWAETGACQMATAELKRYDRLREIKARADDSEHFAKYLENCKTDMRNAGNRDACLGRLHIRRKRAAWLYDTLIVAFFDNNQMARVLLYLEGEEYVIELNNQLTPAQQQYYHAQGLHGEIKSGKHVPRLDDLPLVRFGDHYA